MRTPGCPSCGAKAAARVGSGLCPACLLGLALLEPDEGAGDADSGDELSSAVMLAVLDGGANHTVYLAERQGTRQLMAVEVVRAAAVRSTTPGTFAARIQELRRLSHPGLAAVLGGWVSSTGDYCVASEYVPGAALERYCAARHTGTAERLALFLDACRALASAHDVGVLHGRLGPGSIVVTRRSGHMQPVTTGFGLLAGTSAAPAVDVAPLGEVLERLVGEEPGPRADAARRMARAARGGEIASVGALITTLESLGR